MKELHRLEVALLRELGDGERTVEELAESLSLPTQSVYFGASMLSDKGLARIREVSREVFELTPRGREVLDSGLPEERLLQILKGRDSISMGEAIQALGRQTAVLALGQAKSQGLVTIDRGSITATPKGLSLPTPHPLRAELINLAEGKPISRAKDLLARGLVEKSSTVQRYVSLTEEGKRVQAQSTEEQIVDLTPEVIRSGSWRGKTFRRFDIHSPTPEVYPAKKQPYRRFIDWIRKKLLSMGFVEMTGPLVELSFWNFDALFQAQNHPAREVHDTFMIRNPSRGRLPHRELVERVKAAHENGWTTGSTGWRYKWSEDEASKLVARSQGTALSARTLAAGIDPPVKHFSIARVFRPDVLDRTHLIEFNQCEGIIADENLTFRHLLGVLKMFAVEIAGESNFGFVPSYYPFTEPSVDLVAYSEKQGGWIELGGAGIFREEVTRPLGVDIPVIAWGMGIDRLAMFSLGLDDIRELFSQNLDWLRRSKVVV